MKMGYAPPKGMRDSSPETMLMREKVIDTVRAVFKKYGYVPMDTPAMENIEVLKKKCGEEIAGQIFKVEESDMGLRFDLTVPLARAAGGMSVPKPFKRYCIAPVWRREEPQKARYREFWQADIDIVGSPSMRCEAELLACAKECLSALGFEKIQIRLNNRKILSAMLKEAGVSKENEAAVFRALDKLGKKPEGEVREEMAAKGLQETQIKKLFSYFEGKDNEEKLKRVDFAKEGVQELREILEYAKMYGFEKGITIDLSLVRGLDYYTGPIFEIAGEGGVGTITAGGRYDNLLELYGQKEYATGISLGIERILYLLEKESEKSAPAMVYVAPVSIGYYADAIALVQELRSQGFSVITDLQNRSLSKQLEYANAVGIQNVIIIGEKEKKEGKFLLRNLRTGTETLAKKEEVVNYIKSFEKK